MCPTKNRNHIFDSYCLWEKVSHSPRVEKMAQRGHTIILAAKATRLSVYKILPVLQLCIFSMKTIMYTVQGNHCPWLKNAGKRDTTGFKLDASFNHIISLPYLFCMKKLRPNFEPKTKHNDFVATQVDVTYIFSVWDCSKLIHEPDPDVAARTLATISLYGRGSWF